MHIGWVLEITLHKYSPLPDFSMKSSLTPSTRSSVCGWELHEWCFSLNQVQPALIIHLHIGRVLEITLHKHSPLPASVTKSSLTPFTGSSWLSSYTCMRLGTPWVVYICIQWLCPPDDQLISPSFRSCRLLLYTCTVGRVLEGMCMWTRPWPPTLLT
jgi:hypothetical protein